MTYELVISNSDNSIRTVEFPTMEAAANAGRRINFLGGAALAINAGNDTFYAEIEDGKTTFVMEAAGIRFHV